MWYEDPEYIKVEDSRLLDIAILNRTVTTVVFLPELVEELVAQTDFNEHEIKFNIWRLLGEGKLVRINSGFYITQSPDYSSSQYSFTTVSTKTRGL